MGGETFVESLRQRLKLAIGSARRESHSGAPRRAHDERAAETLLQTGLSRLGIEDLKPRPKWDREKVALAWWLRENTTVSLRWVSHRLEMGHYSRVSQAVWRMARKPSQKLAKLKAKLMQSDS